MEDKTIEILSQCPLFADMSKPEIELTLMGAKSRIVEYNRNDIYALAGMPCRYADIILDGILVCRMSSLSGKQVEVSRLRPGNMIAPAFIFSKDHSLPVSVETATKARIFRLSVDTMKSLIDDNEQLRTNFLRMLSNIDVFLTQKLRFLSLLTVREKVAHLLLERAREQKSMHITLYRSRQEIADSFGIQKYSLMRVIADFEKSGAIAVNGKDITILDKGKML
ncbi:MAG: Crp/Fnr family transcriptional regulator [Prevotella sp.]|uniref:Crp/Fnr family transcriptional regulator n=1 Tax=Prevotella sp. AGR2160 TaxID=1280674 RepID=UPI00048F52D4|nr:Crp/Fnr family transcriptional regulator [Prevotella sp. AGR2160]MDD5861310.1 Crp/Fnr family transcriptional regulator [Prevotella sp.]